MGVHEREDREGLHDDSEGVRARAGAREDHDWRRDGPHTALSRMIEHGLDDHRVMSISGHSSTRMLERYTHPTLERRIAALDTFDLSTNCPQKVEEDAVQRKEAAEAASFLKDFGGRHEARTRDLRVANAALSQLS